MLGYNTTQLIINVFSIIRGSIFDYLRGKCIMADVADINLLDLGDVLTIIFAPNSIGRVGCVAVLNVSKRAAIIVQRAIRPSKPSKIVMSIEVPDSLRDWVKEMGFTVINYDLMQLLGGFSQLKYST